MYLMWVQLVYQCFESVMDTKDQNALENYISEFIIQLACKLSLRNQHFLRGTKHFFSAYAEYAI